MTPGKMKNSENGEDEQPTPKPKKQRSLIDSTQDSKASFLKILGLLAAVALFWNGASIIWNRPSGQPLFASSAPTDAPIETPTAEPTPTESPTSTPYVETVFREIVVTATPEPPTPTPHIEYVYYQVPLEVEKIVTTTVVLEPTATPSLATGTAQICVALEGAREVYIGGHGVVSGGCQTFSFGIGQTTIGVQINR